LTICDKVANVNIMSLKYYKTELNTILESFFAQSTRPANFKDLFDYVQSQQLSFNKSNFYRQLNKMQSTNKIISINTTQGQMWEKSQEKSHSHLECQRCNNVSCISINAQDMTNSLALEEPIVINSINIVGICRQCLQLSGNN
jgi:Fe2+ or Zn2+ uptake regulation protein